ncbi:hypothetical protein HN385_03660 [archaeon]|jgi:hypothetical protein|nr:hypothetical protein [archaeon]MBT3451706.1 hypothetical protein [archaeon]MBT6869794.1 hypothetical protein [archaeon]MBT7192749.1 hypothetical protein [archaeon]MBT7380774.1 hypothetical protein [archaeon]
MITTKTRTNESKQDRNKNLINIIEKEPDYNGIVKSYSTEITDEFQLGEDSLNCKNLKEIDGNTNYIVDLSVNQVSNASPIDYAGNSWKT